MAKQEFLNFKEISSKISFEEVLNWLNIPFEKKKEELKGDGFIVSIEKNLFFSPNNEDVKGSVINFVSHHNDIELREAASLLKRQFLSEKKQSLKKNIPNLVLGWDPYLETRGITPEVAEAYKIGHVHQRSIMSGRIAFKVHNHSGDSVGYIGYKQEEDSWFFPRGFKRPLYNAFRLKGTDSVVVTTDPFDALKFVSQGFLRVVSLLGYSMTPEQEEELRRFKYILLLHPEPTNIVSRLCATSFVRAPVLSKPLMELSEKEFLNLIN